MPIINQFFIKIVSILMEIFSKIANRNMNYIKYNLICVFVYFYLQYKKLKIKNKR